MRSVVAAAVFALLSTPLLSPLSAQRSRDTVPDSIRTMLREINREARQVGRAAYDSARPRIVVSDEALASAFADEQARVILSRARSARLEQDSALSSYRAIGTQRMSLAAGVRRLGLEKLLFRGDNVARIDWSRAGGVWVTPLGSRVQVPMAGAKADGEMVSSISIPYFPGKESLWMPSSEFGVVRADIDERDIIHPLARGAETYYRYATGDSISITLGGERTIQLRELRITARRPQWQLFVGSFWFDQASGQLVRAAYRLSVPIEFWDVASEQVGIDEEREQTIARARDSIARERLPRDQYVRDSIRLANRSSSSDEDEPPGWVKAAFRPARGTLDGVTIEYGLYGGRFWLPRLNTAEFNAEIGPLRTPFTMYEKFEYEDVDGDFTTPPVPPPMTAAQRRAALDSARGDTSAVRAVDREPELSISVNTGGDSLSMSQRDSAARAARCAPGDSTYIRTESRYDGALRVAYTMPCDRSVLRNSAALPPASVSTDELFDLQAAEDLLNALDLSLQPAWGPMRPTLRSGLDQMRYNRVEGFSPGLIAEQVLGAGYTARATGRIGHADLVFNGELQLERSNGRRTVYGSVYQRLRATAPEWGNPLSFGPSLPAVLFARDEGFYFRTLGVEVGDRHTTSNGAFEWRLYTEQQRSAGDTSVVSTWSLGRTLGIGQFRTNFDASRISVTGLDVAISRAFGSDPEGTRVITSLRGEGGTGTVTYGRLALEAQATRPFAKVSTAITGSVGSSVGELPPQRAWFLGGLRTVRGLPPGSQFGNAYWFVRSEVGTRFGFVRPVVFADVGWAGAREDFGAAGTMSGAGGGLSFLDGIFRLDVARNLARGGGWRTDLYFEAPL